MNTVAALRLGWWAFWATALATGWWFAATAAYRWDDHGLLAEAWADGDLGAAIAHVWQMHTEVRAPEGWPKFYRPVYHAIYLADAHVFRASPAASMALSWAAHVGNALLVALLVRRALGASAALFAAWVCLLPGYALDGPAWVAARAQVTAMTGMLAAVAIATAPALPAWRRWFGIAAAFLLAAGSHDFGALAGPLAIWAVVAGDAPRAAWRSWPTTIAWPLALTAVWIVWRASRLGVWVGGYAGSGRVPSLPLAMLESLTTGLGSIVLPGVGHLALGTAIAAGSAALAMFAWLGLAPGPGRTLARVALAIAVTTIVPSVGAIYRAGQQVDGRYLYFAHCAWAMGLACLVAKVGAWRGRAVAATVATLALGAGAAGFAAATAALERAHAVVRDVSAAIDRLPTDRQVALVGVPLSVERHSVMPGQFPLPFQPPFCAPKPHIVGLVSEYEMTNGMTLNLAAACVSLPPPALLQWDAAARDFRPRIVAGPASTPLRAALDPPTADGDGMWTFRGEPGDGVLLVVGDEPCEVDLGVSGVLRLASPHRLPIGLADERGELRFALPAAARTFRWVQAGAVRNPRRALGDWDRLALTGLHATDAGR